MTSILGISAFYHDSAASLIQDGRIVAAAQEERFTRQKHDESFPARAIDYCLKAGGLASSDLDYVAFYDKPFTKFERLLETFLGYAPRGFGNFYRAIPVWLKDKLHLRAVINRHLHRPRHRSVVFLDHHESHAASAFFPSPFDEAAILTVDGVGEWSTTTLGMGSGNTLKLADHLRFPHSLGLLYSAFTAYCGFKVNDGEYKLMGLAPYGQPVYRDLILKELIDLKADGSFRLNMDYFPYGHSPHMTNRRFHRLLGGTPRHPQTELDQRHKDLAASIQVVTEEVLSRIIAQLQRRTGLNKLVMAGGVALNCVANGRLLREGPFEEIWVQPAAGDAGGSLGAALFVWHQLLGHKRKANSLDSQQGSLLGPQYTPEDIGSFLDENKVQYRCFSTQAELLGETSKAIDSGKVVGWYQGRMEFGPRALGSRSILADARHPRMQSILNQKIKFREDFRPFAPAVLTELAHEWFELPRGHESPYMLLVGPVRADRRSMVPAITHVDGSARVQTVDSARNPLFHALLQAFYQRTGCPLVVNTSFNVADEPIVCTPEDAYYCFLKSGIDVLVMGNYFIEKDRAHAMV